MRGIIASDICVEKGGGKAVNKPMSILIVSYYFAPQNVIGAIRATKLAKYLARMGHRVTVVCGEGITPLIDPMLQRDLTEFADVHVVREWNVIRDRKRKNAAETKESSHLLNSPGVKNNRRSWKAWVLDKLHLFLLFWADCSFARRGLQEITEMEKTFDVVLTSYGPLSSLWIGNQVKKQGLAKRWLADFRDPVILSFSWQKGVAEYYRKQAQRNADGICAVSQGVLERMAFYGNIRVIPNGFDREDLLGIETKQDWNPAVLNVAYCGQIYEGKQFLTPFFRAVRRMIAEGICQPEEIRIFYVGREGSRLKAQAQETGMEGLLQDRGQVTREKSLALQQEVDVLLMASWNEKGTPGILTGKLKEYMMMQKPILCCMSGDAPESETKALIHGLGLGFCWEEANGKEDEEKLYAYLKELLARKRNGERLLAEENSAGAEVYAYPEIAKTLSEWMEQMQK